ncbi:MAG: peptidoglycan binding domain-containing protein [Blautia sp.]|nr:peptidoglycan binding domain-containing protein [Blautia sp.]
MSNNNQENEQREDENPFGLKFVQFDVEKINREPEVPIQEKNHKGWKITGIVALMLLTVLTCGYAGASYYYSNRFFDGTIINGIDCSRKTAFEVEQEIASQVESYKIEVAARSHDPQTIYGSDINYRYLSDGEVLALLKEQKPYEWIRGLFEKRECTTAKNISFDRRLLENQLKSLECSKAENQVYPENAYVAYTDNKFEIIPETQGTALNIKRAYLSLEKAISESSRTVDLNADPKAYRSAAVTRDSEQLNSTLEAYNNFANASITYTFGDSTEVLDGSTIRNWLNFDAKGQLVKDDTVFRNHIAEYVAGLAEKYDTVGTEREFSATNGRVVNVKGYAYGWQIDQNEEIEQIRKDIQSGARVTREPIYAMTANCRGKSDIGDTYIEVDLSYQHMYYYQNGSIIFDSDFVSGNMSYSDRQTPSGIYQLYNKKSPEVLRGAIQANGLPEYETPVSYWMPFNGGIGFHDATWRWDFGGNIYQYDGSHGCINLPLSNAAVLYDIIQYNVPIICFY